MKNIDNETMEKLKELRAMVAAGPEKIKALPAYKAVPGALYMLVRNFVVGFTKLFIGGQVFSLSALTAVHGCVYTLEQDQKHVDAGFQRMKLALAMAEASLGLSSPEEFLRTMGMPEDDIQEAISEGEEINVSGPDGNVVNFDLTKSRKKPSDLN